MIKITILVELFWNKGYCTGVVAADGLVLWHQGISSNNTVRLTHRYPKAFQVFNSKSVQEGHSREHCSALLYSES